MEIARLDEQGKLIAVEACSKEDYRTDSISRTVRLEPGHDMRKRMGQYRFDYNRNTFLALSNEPLEVAERDTAELLEGIIEAIEDIYEYISNLDLPDAKMRLSPRTKRSIGSFRKRQPRKERRVLLDNDIPAGPQFVAFGASFVVRPPQ